MLAALALLAHAADPLPDAARYASGDLTWCDVHLLAAALDTWDGGAVEAAQALIAEGKAADVHAAVAAARLRFADRVDLCPLLEAGIPYEAVRMSADVQSIPAREAHDRWVKRLIAGEYVSVRAEAEGLLGEPPEVDPPAWARPKADDAAAFSAWQTSSYTWCDAQILSISTGVPEKQAAIGIGRLVQQGRKAEATRLLTEARAHPLAATRCALWSLPYTPAQLPLLAARSGLAPDALGPALEDAARKGELGRYHFLLSPAWEPETP